MTAPANAVIYRLSEFGDLAQRIAAIRDHGERMAKYKADLKTYQKQRHGRAEVDLQPLLKTGWSTSLVTGKYIPQTGFLHDIPSLNKVMPVLRPTEPRLVAWGHQSASTSSFMGIRSHEAGGDYGLLADGGKFNRPVNEQRVGQYQKLMQDGQWNDLLSDPIAITSDGEVINGQHRLAAGAALSNFGPDDRDPQFLVLFDVDPAEVAFADTSKRTGRDLTVIAQKSVKA
jgi:hypothetical protein